MRLLDIVFSLICLVCLSPLLVAAALLVKLGSPGPVFFRAPRVGEGGRKFRLLKFRTMVEGSVDMGPGVTGADDNRITGVGRVLRATKIDELPQLFNVLKGEMALVGPRPEDPRYVTFYTPEQKRLLKLRPGITSPASVAFRHESQLVSGPQPEETYLQRILPAKLEIDLKYFAARSFFSDIGVLVKTFLSLFRTPKDPKMMESESKKNTHNSKQMAIGG